MFIYNFKLNKTNIFKICFVLVVIILLILFGICSYKIYKETTNNKIKTNNIANITANNYTNILKAVHDNLDNYIGQNINFSGYVYRVEDFKKDEFVLARDMLIDNNSQSLVVGFLCNYKNAENFPDKTWIEVKGTITKGDYHGEIPVIKIKDVKIIEKPQDDFVCPPDDYYIPTSFLYYKED